MIKCHKSKMLEDGANNLKANCLHHSLTMVHTRIRKQREKEDERRILITGAFITEIIAGI